MGIPTACLDRDVIEKGLNELAGERDVVLSQGRGPRADESSLTLGVLALFNGLDMDLTAYGQFVEKVNEDHGVVGPAIQEAFILATRSAGIPFGDE